MRWLAIGSVTAGLSGHRDQRAGRPSISRIIVALVDETATANPLWGAPRIHGGLRMLGIDVSERTVSRILERRPRSSSLTWKRSSRITSHARRRWNPFPLVSSAAWPDSKGGATRKSVDFQRFLRLAPRGGR